MRIERGASRSRLDGCVLEKVSTRGAKRKFVVDYVMTFVFSFVHLHRVKGRGGTPTRQRAFMFMCPIPQPGQIEAFRLTRVELVRVAIVMYIKPRKQCTETRVASDHQSDPYRCQAIGFQT